MAAKGVNKVILIGNLGKDPEVRYTGSGVAVASFSLATNESWTNPEGERVEKTEWHNLVAWRKLAEICGQYLKKGHKIYVEGKLQTHNYDDKNGVKRYVTEIVIDEMVMLGGGREAGSAGPDQAPSPPPGPSAKDDDLPF